MIIKHQSDQGLYFKPYFYRVADSTTPHKQYDSNLGLKGAPSTDELRQGRAAKRSKLPGFLKEF